MQDICLLICRNMCQHRCKGCGTGMGKFLRLLCPCFCQEHRAGAGIVVVWLARDPATSLKVGYHTAYGAFFEA